TAIALACSSDMVADQDVSGTDRTRARVASANQRGLPFIDSLQKAVRGYKTRREPTICVIRFPPLLFASRVAMLDTVMPPNPDSLSARITAPRPIPKPDCQ